MSWRMHSETAPQSRVWMAFPSSGYALGESAAEAERARRTWASVANAIVDFEPVVLVVNPGDEVVAAKYVSAQVEIVSAPLNDAWMRDIGPTFVSDGDTIGAVDWTFNGWGQQSWAQWDKDQHIGSFVAQAAGAQLISSALVNEGGGIHVDGAGTLFATESVQLDPLRNPGWTKAEVEAEFARTLGATNVVWLPRGLYRDAKEFGTKGHVDIVAAPSDTHTLLVHDQPNAEHPDHEIMATITGALATAQTAEGGAWELTKVPAPVTLRDNEDFVDYSYINHLVINNAVIACTFDDPMDAVAQEILGDAYGRDVIGVDARELFARGGGIHCITQHQPLV